MPADDLTDPAPATTFAHLDATTVLSRAIAELGIYPAVDPLDSTSRIMDPNIVGNEHYDVARGVQKILQVSIIAGGISVYKIRSRKTKTLILVESPHDHPKYVTFPLTCLLIKRDKVLKSFVQSSVWI